MNNKKKSGGILFLIKTLLVFTIGTGIFSTYGLNYEKKISDIYDKIDKIDMEKKYLN